MGTVSILGCGWLGLPLAEHLVKSGYKVKGSTRTTEDLPILKSKGIESYLIVLDPDLKADNPDSFFDSEVLIINFPPERRDDIVSYHDLQIKSLIDQVIISPISKVLFVSSTSVYPDLNRIVTEEDVEPPTKNSGKALLMAEDLLNQCDEFNTTVLRFSGLIGYDRKPGRFLAGKKGVQNGDAPVNLIHRDDCINIIENIIENEIWNETLNACADMHPKRKDYYIHAASELGLDPPIFLESNNFSYKIVSSEKLKRKLGYIYKYPNPSDIRDD